nr:MAG TPA: hypothetical protein [Caudoviricetes sp.]
MMNYTLPTEIQIEGLSYPINKNGDYRMILDVISVLNDDSLADNEKAVCALAIFYNFNVPDDAQEAVNEMMRFINCGELEEKSSQARQPIMNWEQDFNVLVAPINKALGIEIRSVPYLHWWTFISGYMEIGECQFSTIVTIRQKRQKGKKLEKWEQEFYNENRKKVDLKPRFDDEEQKFLNSILGTDKN